MNFKILIVAAATSLVIAATAFAGGRQDYSLSLTGVSNGEASFLVTRSIVGEENLRNDPLAYVQIRCDGQALSQDEAPVIWGTWDSPTGTASLPVAGNSCEAYVTVQPWNEKVYPRSEVIVVTP